MLLLLVCVAEFFLFSLLLWSRLWVWTVLLVFLYATLYYYLDNGPIHGHRSWDLLRLLSWWKVVSPVRYEFTNAEAIHVLDKPCLFLVMPNATNMALLYGFGFHGGALPLPTTKSRERSVVYLLPQLLFKVPLLRDYLLWSGAVADYGFDSVLDHINSGRCVAYSPSGMSDLLYQEQGQLVIKKPGPKIFEFARENGIHIVPVLVYGEEQRYHIFSKPETQSYFYQLLGWPFPFWVFPRIFGAGPPPPLRLFVGNPMKPNATKNDDDFYKLFFGAIKGMNNCGSDRELVIKD